MKLWTIQHINVWQRLQQNKTYMAQKLHICDTYFIKPYDWMKNHLSKIDSPKDNANYPVWAWTHKPDLRMLGHFKKGTNGVRIEFNIDNNKVLLSDFDLWNHVLNYLRIGNDNETIEQSWEKIFDLNLQIEDIACKQEDKLFQAVFWELKLEQVAKVTEFVAR